MTYLAFEESVEDSAPIELYLFQNTEEAFSYTSANVSKVFNGRVYVPSLISSGEDELESLEEQRKIVVSMPADDPFVQRYYISLPSSQDDVTIYRVHTTDGDDEVTTKFVGKVANIAIVGNEAKVNCLSQASVLERTIPKQTCRALCNHILYDTRCKLVDTTYRIQGTVTAKDDTARTVTVNFGTNTLTATGLQFSAQVTADINYFNGGSLERGGLERRMIRFTVNQGSNVGTFTLLLPFSQLNVGDAVDLFAGCDHTFTTCTTKFDNEENFGGFPYVPRKNPFNSGIDV